MQMKPAAAFSDGLPVLIMLLLFNKDWCICEDKHMLQVRIRDFNQMMQ